MNKTRRFEALYARIPGGFCKGLCQRACGPIQLTRFERTRITGGPAIPLAPELTCPLLGEDGACTVYDKRPLICRLWGAVDEPRMACPHGCVPAEGLLDNLTATEMILQSRNIGGGHVALWSDDPEANNGLQERLQAEELDKFAAMTDAEFDALCLSQGVLPEDLPAYAEAWKNGTLNVLVRP